ncbi:MAG: OsmC family protein [Acidimicrobiia bacterium]
MTTITKINQVDIETVGALVASIQDDPGKADTTWKAEARWQKGFRVDTTSREFTPVAYDEPPALGGTNLAPNPVEQILGAFGACLAIGYAANASTAGITIDDLRIELEGDLNLHTFLGLDDGHAGFSQVRATVHLQSGADPEAIAALHQKVVTTSPVGHTLTGTVAVTVDLA